MKTEFWFNRLIEYWTLPRAEEVVEHVIRGKVQVVQIGNFGSDVSVDRVEWIYPEMKSSLELYHEVIGNRVYFDIPRLIVYGISVIYID